MVNLVGLRRVERDVWERRGGLHGLGSRAAEPLFSRHLRLGHAYLLRFVKQGLRVLSVVLLLERFVLESVSALRLQRFLPHLEGLVHHDLGGVVGLAVQLFAAVHCGPD